MRKSTSKRGNGGGGKTKKKKSSNSPSRSSSAKKLDKYLKFHSLSILVLIVAAILALGSRHGGDGMHDITEHVDDEGSKVQRFLTWIIDNGGTISPQVTLNVFPEYGGYGLMSLSRAPLDNSFNKSTLSLQEEEKDNQLDSDAKSFAIIQHLEEMFTIPPTIITSVESVLVKYSSVIPDIRQRLERSVRPNFPSTLEQQDVIIALSLMAECALGQQSNFKPYLEVLPMDVVSRLDTFDEDELVELQDEYLSSLARESKRKMKVAWEGSGGGGYGLKELAKLMANHAASSFVEKIHLKQTCLTYDSFHKYTSIVSSRAMVLHGTKYLTPLADMLNYAPQQQSSKKKNDDPCQIKSLSSFSSFSPPPVQSFTLYHERNNGSSNAVGSITVRSDRDVFKGGEQIFEDYGNVDNSLFLEAHGFVPYENPSHCAVITPEPSMLPNMMQGDDFEKKKSVMRYLNILPPSTTTDGTSQQHDIPIICVKPDGSISEELAASYLIISNIWNQKHGGNKEQQQKRCLDAVKRNDKQLATIQCLRHDGWRGALHDTVQQSACHTLKMATTSLEFDLKLVDILHGKEEQKSTENMEEHGEVIVTESNVKRLNTTRGMIALRFRIAEKKILAHLCEGTTMADDLCSANEMKTDRDIVDNKANRYNDEDNHDHEHRGSEAIDDSREIALEEFRAYIRSMNLPVNKVEPKYIGNGLRLGVVATENMTKDNIYLSIPDSRTINVDTIFRLVSETNEDSMNSTHLKALLEKYRLSGGGKNDGGFQIMLLYLLHERFVAKEKSQWWPYLKIIPTVEEVKNKSPLFFDEEKIDYLEGSAVKMRLVQYRETAQNRFAHFSTDYDTLLALGSEIALDWDKFLWAYSILDSRSIWWDGKRNLVPLLDLVNCMEVYEEDEDNKLVPNVIHSTTVDKNGENAVTKISHTVKVGDQVFENYGQPNHIYFLYHGFLLEHNTHDCALWDDIRIKQDDAVAAFNERQSTMQRLGQNGFSSFEPSFCIKDILSLHRVADFLRIKNSISNEDKLEGLGSDVNDYIRDMLQKTLYRYDQIISVRGERSEKERHEGNEMTYAEQTMLKLLHNERAHFQRALDELNQECYISED